MSERIRIVVAVVSLGVGAGTSTMQWSRAHAAPAPTGPAAQLCGERGERGERGDSVACAPAPVAAVAFSTLAGLPFAAIGALAYASVAALLLLGLLAGDGSPAANLAGKLAFTFAGLAGAIQLLLFGVRLFGMHGSCALCLATLGAIVLVFVLLLPFRARPYPAVAELPPHHLLLGGWLLCTAALLLAVVSGERWLRADSVARGVQETLDDPDKRDRYFEDKAVVKFNQTPVETFALRPATRLGADTGPIVILEFADYLCPLCLQLSHYFDEYLPQVRGRVVVYVMNLPLDQSCNPHLDANYHPGACWMALGAVCAERAGKFTEFYRAAFDAALSSAGPPEVLRVGVQAGLERASLDRCLRAPDTRAAVLADIEEAERTHARGTPTLFINGRKAPLWTYLDRLVTVESVRVGLR